jgi:peptidoglycan/LPS O-acetylase OafA/YrhL
MLDASAGFHACEYDRKQLATTTTPVRFRRNVNLDALRAIAIFMVLGRHSGYSAYWIKIGWAGVDLFFVLSGFLVSGLLFMGYQERGRIDFSRFYIRRGLKIWPAFYVLIATGLLLTIARGHSVSTKGLLPELVFMQSYFQGIWGITWSLAVEEHFYLILPVVLLLMLRRDSKRPFAAMPYVFAAIAILALACRFAVGWKENGNSDYLTYLYPTHLRIDGLMFGVLLSYYNTFRPNVFARIASWRGSWIVVAAAVILLSTFPVENRNMHTWGLTVIYLGAGCLVAKAKAFEGPSPVRVLSSLLARIGVYSYSIYLWHIFFTQRVLVHLHITSRALWFWCYFIGAILFGIAAAEAIEIPVLRFRDRVFPRSSKSSVTLNSPPSTETLAKAHPGTPVLIED